MQTPADRLAADARLAPFGRRQARYLAVLVAMVTLVQIGDYLAAIFQLTARPGTVAVTLDFRVFWAAARLALEGDPLAVLDQARLGEVHATNPDTYMPWLYPPGFLTFVTRFGMLDFAPALLAWTALSLLTVTVAFRPFVARQWPRWVLLVLAPAAFPALMLGQNSLFWMAGLLAALAALRAGRWVLAGICIGFLTLKPHLGLLIPVALLAIGAWRTILAATGTAVLLAALPTLAYDAGYWPLLLAGMAEHGALLRQQAAAIDLMISPMYLLAHIGLTPDLALALQGALGLALAGLVFCLWRSDLAGFDLKVAVLLIAILLSAPYLWNYEGTLLPAVGLFLLRAGVLTLRAPLLVLLVLLWLGAELQTLNTSADLVDQRWLGGDIVPPVLLLCLILCLRHLTICRPFNVERA